VDLTYTAEEEAFRAEARTWLAANVPAKPLQSFDTAEGFEQHRAWEARLFEGRWSAVSWPAEYGGRGADYIKWLIFEEEYYRADAPGRVNQNGVFLLGPTLMDLGTDAQKAHFLPRMAAGQDIWCQGWSEPNAGSDMAAIQCRATLSEDGAEWILEGQKTWSSRGAFADWLFGLFRTQPDSQRHHGLSFLLVPLRSPGITVRPIRQLDGTTGFAEIFFDGARIRPDNVVGEVHQGWRVAMATAGFERGVSLRSPARFTRAAQRLVDLFQRLGSPASLREAITGVWMDAEAYRLNTTMAVSRMLDGQPIGAEASFNKIFWSEMDLRLHDLALQLLGPRATLVTGAAEAVDGGRWLDGFLFAQAGPIYAGTNEIQRNIIADRVLNLPRGR
jgi:alkylation response protein AidB-like acyl-CoA dehydrogenase